MNSPPTSVIPASQVLVVHDNESICKLFLSLCVKHEAWQKWSDRMAVPSAAGLNPHQFVRECMHLQKTAEKSGLTDIFKEWES